MVEPDSLDPVGEELLKRLEKVAKSRGADSLHRLLRRDVAVGHRDLDRLLTAVESGKSFYVYTGIGPSTPNLHLGHLVPFTLAKWLQDVFGAAVVIQISDDEKFLWEGLYDPDKGKDNLPSFQESGIELAKDIIALGFDKSKTFLLSNVEYAGNMYPNIVRLWKSLTYATAKPLFSLQGDSNIGQSAFPAMQAAPAFPSSLPVLLGGRTDLLCLVISGVDQDPFFQVAREAAPKLVLEEHPLQGMPAVLYTRFLPSVQGTGTKMSASDGDNAFFLSDNAPKVIKKKVQSCFSGGQQFAEDQKKMGADLSKDVSVDWLRYLLDDDAELQQIKTEYGSGQGEYWATGFVKKRLTALLEELTKAHGAKRGEISRDEVKEWMAVRPLTL